MNGTKGLKRSTVGVIVSSVGLAAVCVAGLRGVPSAHAQTKLPAFSPRMISGTYTENLPALRQIDEMTANLAEFVEPGVVHIRSESKPGYDVMGQRMPRTGGQGSGFIYRPDGYIITNDHVVGGFDTVTVVLDDGRELPGRVIRAQDVDVAVVKVEANDLPTLQFGDSSKVRPGQFSMAVGAPFGLEDTVTFGHISALGRTNRIRDDRLNLDRDYPDLIQTDTPINMGNSGGPLINIEGQVIGINTAIYSQTGMNNGIGFAIPSNTVRMIADKLIQDGKVTRGALGLAPTTLKSFEGKKLGLDGGAVVQRVENGTPAAMAGIQKDDVIVRIGNLPIKNETDVRLSMLNYAPGEKVEIEVVRNKAHKTFNVTLTSPDKLPKDAPTVTEPSQDDPFGGLKIPDLDELRKQMEKQGGSDPSKPGLKEGNAKLGVTVGDLTAALREQFTIPSSVQGVVVTSVAPGFPAEKIGIKEGDVIQELGGKPVSTTAELMDAMKGRKWGESSSIKFTRYGKQTAVSQTLTFTF